MSGLAGVIWRDGRPARPADAIPLLHWLQYRGGDGSGLHATGSAALGIALQHVTESSVETQPWVDRVSGTVVTWDGRLDNRSALTELLDLGVEMGDAAIAARAFDRWGIQAPEYLLGDFAVVWWRPSERLLLAARDVMGIRPFCYQETSTAWRWASDAHALVRDQSPRINEGMVGEHLANRVTSPRETLFEGVLRLPPAHALTWRNGDVRTWRYWSPRIDPFVATGTAGELDEELRSRMREAVRCRLRSTRPVAVFLSGGVDSSIVAAQAARLAPGFVSAFSFDAINPRASERTYFTAVAAQHGLPLEVRKPAPLAAEMFERDAQHFLDLPDAPTSMIASPLRAAARERGHHVVLTGIGGDEWFFGTQLVAADYLARGQFRSLLRRFRDDHDMPGEHAPGAVLRLALWLQLGDSTRRRLRGVLRRRVTPLWIDPVFARRVSLEDRLRAAPMPPLLPTHDSRETFKAATCADIGRYREAVGRTAARWSLEFRHPFHDRRVLEFALSLPAEHRLEGSRPKAILRRAFASDLPGVVHERGAGPDFAFAVAEAIEELGGSCAIEGILRRDPGRLAAPVVRALYGRLRERGAADPTVLARTSWPLWLGIAIDFWQCALASGSRATGGIDNDDQAIRAGQHP